MSGSIPCENQMNLDLDDSAIQPRLRVLQMIAGALIMGVVVFAMVAIATGNRGGGGAGGSGGAPGPASASAATLRYVAAAVLFSGITVAFIMNAVMRKSVAGPPDFQQTGEREPLSIHLVFNRFFTMTIISLALLEGPALFGAVIVLLTGDMPDLAFVAVPVVGMLALYPTQNKWRNLLQSAAAMP